MTDPSGRRPRLLYICDWLPPDFGAVGQYSELFARQFAQADMDVVLGGLSSKGSSETLEQHSGGSLKIIKLFARPYRKDNFAQRLLWTFKTNTRLALSLWPAMRWADEILFPGSPPLFLHWIAPLNLFLRKRLVYRITDFHPECLIAARAPVRVADAGLCLTVFWRRRARRVIKGAMISIDEARIRKLPGRFSCSRADRVRLWRRQLSSTALARRNRPGLSQPATRRALATRDERSLAQPPIT